MSNSSAAPLGVVELAEYLGIPPAQLEGLKSDFEAILEHRQRIGRFIEDPVAFEAETADEQSIYDYGELAGLGWEWLDERGYYVNGREVTGREWLAHRGRGQKPRNNTGALPLGALKDIWLELLKIADTGHHKRRSAKAARPKFDEEAANGKQNEVAKRLVMLVEFISSAPVRDRRQNNARREGSSYSVTNLKSIDREFRRNQAS